MNKEFTMVPVRKAVAEHSRGRKLGLVAEAAALAGLACSLSLAANAVVAEESELVLEEIIITAERREGSLQEVPIAVSTFSQSDLEALQVETIGDLQSLVPNLSLHVGDANNAVVYIRGIGQIDSIAFFEPGVGIYLDDVYLGRAQGAFLDVVDVDRIEVLRGPQGSLYGRNTVGGAIKYVSAKPTEEFSGNISATLGNFERRDFKATVSGPLVGDALTGRLAIASLEHEGYSENAFDNGRDGDRDVKFGRGVLQFDPSDTLSMSLAIDYTNSDPDRSRTPAKESPTTVTVLDPFTFLPSVEVFPADEDPFRVNADFNRTEFTETKGYHFNVSWALSDAWTFNSISAYRELDYGTELDLDGTPINSFGIIYFNEQEQLSQELQLAYQGERLSAVGGLFYYNEDGSTFDGAVTANFLAAVAGESEFETESYAIFGQADYELNEKWTATFGFRYTEEEKSYQRMNETFDLTLLAGIMPDPVTSAVTGYANPELLSPSASDLALGGGIGVVSGQVNPDDADFDNFSPKVGVKYQATDDTNYYATISTGFKSGGFNGRTAANQAEPYDEETLISYEVGMKHQFWDDRARLNIAVFRNDYEDLQVSSFEAVPPADPSDPPSLLPIFTNAGEARIQGAEVEFLLRATEELTVNFNVGYLDAEYKEFLAGADPTTGQVLDIADQRELVNSPKWDTFLGLTYDASLGDMGILTVQGDVSYRSKTYLEVNNREVLAQGGYSLMNAAMIFSSESEAWQFILGIKNITDKEYRTHAFDLSAFPGVDLGYYNPPRTYSLAAKYNF